MLFESICGYKNLIKTISPSNIFIRNSQQISTLIDKMLYMMQWSMKDGNAEKAVHRFLGNFDA